MELLENVMLNESGGELEARDYRFVWYADDMFFLKVNK